MIWTKIKAAADAAASVVKSGCLLMWPQDDDGVISLKYKDSAGNIGTIAGGMAGSISDHISIVDGYWCLDGVSTGVAATGEQGEKGDTGATGATGATGEQGEQGEKGDVGGVTAIVSSAEPSDPTNGMIWIEE